MSFVTTGKNGDRCVSSTSDARLDFFQCLRTTSPEVAEQRLRSALEDEAQLEDVVALLCQCRDVRGGKGERDLFITSLLAFATTDHDRCAAALAVLRVVPEYGSYRDLRDIYLAAGKRLNALEATTASGCGPRETLLACQMECLRIFRDVLLRDQDSARPSLCAKWAPREGRKRHGYMARTLALLMAQDGTAASTAYASYRRTIAGLNKRLGTCEVKLCAQDHRWADVAPGAVPCCALKKYKKAFLAGAADADTTPDGVLLSDERRRDRVACAANFREHLRSGKAVHGAVLHCYQLVQHYYDQSHCAGTWSVSTDEVVEAQWQDMVGRIRARTPSSDNGPGRLVPLCDVSGSMSGLPMLVSIALGAVLSEVTHESFRDRVLTFESNPKWVSLAQCSTLRDKVRALKDAPWGGSTNFDAAMDLILKQCLAHRVPAEDVPDALVVFSDMQFDSANGRHGFAHERVRAKFAAAGYPRAPHIVFWNLRETRTFAAPAAEPGVSMLAGFSQSLLDTFLAGGDLAGCTPVATMEKIIRGERYDAARAACRGPFPPGSVARAAAAMERHRQTVAAAERQRREQKCPATQQEDASTVKAAALTTAPTTVEEEVPCPPDAASCVIGKQGANMKELVKRIPGARRARIFISFVGQPARFIVRGRGPTGEAVVARVRGALQTLVEKSVEETRAQLPHAAVVPCPAELVEHVVRRGDDGDGGDDGGIDEVLSACHRAGLVRIHHEPGAADFVVRASTEEAKVAAVGALAARVTLRARPRPTPLRP